MRKIWIGLLAIFALSSFVMSYMFACYAMATINDFTTKVGVLSKDIEVSVDIDDGHHTMMTFYLEGEPHHYSLGGHLLSLADNTIYQLEVGDIVRFWILNEPSKNFLDKALYHNSIWGIMKEDTGQLLLSLDDAIDQRNSTESRVYMVLFLIMGLYFSRSIYQQIKQ